MHKQWCTQREAGRERTRRTARLPWFPLLLALGCGELEPGEPEPGEVEPHEAPAAQAAPSATPAVVEPSPCGQTAATLEPKSLLDTGHGMQVSWVKRAGDRVTSQGGQRWVLWDAAAKKQLANGQYSVWISGAPGDTSVSRAPRYITADVVGDLAITPARTALAFDLRDARDAKVLATVPLDDRGVTLSGIARDGSYVFVASDRSLRMWDRAGRLRNEVAGNFTTGPFAAAEPGILRVAVPNSQHIVALGADGTPPATSRYEGEFVRWFLDGKHFVVRNGPAIAVHRADGALVQSVAVGEGDPRVEAGGDGQFVWLAHGASKVVRVLRLGTGAEALRFEATFAESGRGSQTAFQLDSSVQIATKRLRFLDLRGAEPVVADRDLSLMLGARVSVDEAGGWVAGAHEGILQIGSLTSPEPAARLGCGRIYDLSAAGERVAIGTGDDRIRIYDFASGTPVLVRTLEGERMRELSFADHGRYLVVQRRSGELEVSDFSVRVFDAATGSLVHAWPDVIAHEPAPPSDRVYLEGFAAARSADRIARVLCTGAKQCAVEVTKLDGTPLFTTPRFVRSDGRDWAALSPDGERVALTVASGSGSELVVYEAGGLLASVPGAASVEWLDDERLLVSQPQRGVGSLTTIMDAFGAPLIALPPGISFARKRDESTATFSDTTRVYRINDGSLLWNAIGVTGLNPMSNGMNAVTSKRVVHASDHKVIVDVLP